MCTFDWIQGLNHCEKHVCVYQQEIAPAPFSSVSALCDHGCRKSAQRKRLDTEGDPGFFVVHHGLRKFNRGLNDDAIQYLYAEDYLQMACEALRLFFRKQALGLSLCIEQLKHLSQCRIEGHGFSVERAAHSLRHVMFFPNASMAGDVL